ncbi:MAG: chemotaxis protein CheW [Burkholderiales bacterium]|nr:chemotaxis protein CheW [Burkholderiales bacterium]
MANRDALRQFQTHLANRLQEARTSGVTASWLAVEAANGKYLFPLTQAGEIFPWTSARPVPYTNHWFLGVANLRGGLFGVVDLGGFVTGAERNSTVRDNARLVALNGALEINCALLIDRLAGLRTADAFRSSVPRAPDTPAFFGSGYIDAEGAYWQEINLQLLSQTPEFLSISA